MTCTLLLHIYNYCYFAINFKRFILFISIYLLILQSDITNKPITITKEGGLRR